MAADGSGQIAVVPGAAAPLNAGCSWTPDGTSLVFERFGRKGFRGTAGIHEINVATKVVTSRNASAGRFPNRSRVN